MRTGGDGADPDDWPSELRDAGIDPWDDFVRDEFDTDFSPDSDAPPVWFPGQHLPGDARRMGLTHHVPDGALLDFAGNLSSHKPLHRVTAWVLLVVFGLPVVFALMRIWVGLTG
ncbi:MAG: hypothetical protein CMH83_02790 [Nocardioides sp.]|nr:hypothetical protein [Nocardioides sp.]